MIACVPTSWRTEYAGAANSNFYQAYVVKKEIIKKCYLSDMVSGSIFIFGDEKAVPSLVLVSQPK